MTSPQILGPLSAVHQMLIQLLESIPEDDAYRSYHPDLPPLAWLLGLSVYLESYWLREVLQGDDGLTARVRHLFAADAQGPGSEPGLPPRDHLLNWALEAQDENLMRLANPSLLPASPLLEQQRLQQHILQQQHLIYERMLAVMAERGLSLPADPSFRVRQPLIPAHPTPQAFAGVSQGHYRIGARDPITAFDNELPPQMLELSSYRICHHPVNNGEFLAFLADGGYENPELWGTNGLHWLERTNRGHPRHWRRDAAGKWHGVGVNGPFELAAEDAVMGLSRHEAQAFARWAAATPGLEGAVLQHEYQWEVAVRTQALRDHGRVREWCANVFMPYSEFQPAPDGLGATGDFGNHFSLRGACLHTQPSLRRPSFRYHADADADYIFSGTRLVLPPLTIG